MAWRYREESSGLALGRSEGLAVASLVLVAEGGLSSRGRASLYQRAGVAMFGVIVSALAFTTKISTTSSVVPVAPLIVPVAATSFGRRSSCRW